MRVIALVMLLGCQSSSSRAPLAAPAAATRTVVDLHPFSISWQGKTIARLHADGSTEAVGQKPPGSAMSAGPTLRADGTVSFNTPGVTAQLRPSGELFVVRADGTADRFGTIAENTLVAGSRTIRVEGPLLFFDRPRGDDIGAIDGPVDDQTRHTALVMFAAFMIELGLGP